MLYSWNLQELRSLVCRWVAVIRSPLFEFSKKEDQNSESKVRRTISLRSFRPKNIVGNPYF
ncbi:hypothetical protein DLM75_04145 [Leptospira stimsonii]|uniref:Uncharacterized protein n=1 Tax=Leptospira stimsonii TaxID=2202203 RepID=A0A396ZGW4_9LEPT|nr:hypothetical protein DLM75_04145 [Leptospira stimsonii]